METARGGLIRWLAATAGLQGPAMVVGLCLLIIWLRVMQIARRTQRLETMTCVQDASAGCYETGVRPCFILFGFCWALAINSTRGPYKK